MASGPIVYRVEDRSLLLPYYRRYLVDPTLPYLPASLSPNTITHAGHLLALVSAPLLVGLYPRSGWLFVVSTVLLQIYLWCDNADGAHARRTGQCSTYGEFLDHGLDQLNTVYIAYLTAMALGAPPLWWVVITLVIPGAGAVAYWEQSRTGVFRLGLLNQIESLTVLSFALLVSAVYGTDIWQRVEVGGITARLAMLTWSLTTILFGMVRGMVRVSKHAQSLGAVMPILVLIGFAAGLAGAAATGVVSTVAGVVIATGLNVYFGIRMLALRLRQSPPRVETTVVLGGALLGGLALFKLAGHEVNPLASPALATAFSLVFAAQVLMDTRDGLGRLGQMEQDQAMPALK